MTVLLALVQSALTVYRERRRLEEAGLVQSRTTGADIFVTHLWSLPLRVSFTFTDLKRFWGPETIALDEVECGLPGGWSLVIKSPPCLARMAFGWRDREPRIEVAQTFGWAAHLHRPGEEDSFAVGVHCIVGDLHGRTRIFFGNGPRVRYHAEPPWHLEYRPRADGALVLYGVEARGLTGSSADWPDDRQITIPRVIKADSPSGGYRIGTDYVPVEFLDPNRILGRLQCSLLRLVAQSSTLKAA